MPVYSMTGYAAVSGPLAPAAPAAPDAAPCALRVELRAVNGRFLDLTLRLPDELRATEPALRERVAARVRRGKLELRVSLEQTDEADVRLPSPGQLQRLAAAQEQVRAWLPQAAPLTVAEVLQWSQRSAARLPEAGAALLTLAEQALQELQQARAREGQRLAMMLLDRVQQLRALAAQAEPLVPLVVAQQRERYLQRLREALGGAVAADSPTLQERALTEAAAFALRIDVAEELTRLRSHLDEIERLLHQGGEVGRRLDFLIQELHREANTLGAKAGSLELTQLSVDMKVLVEQMREQVQNLE
ncbi:MAG: YicC/YloC family endoribonuclease [Tepidimonas sp.]|uniref:YicC/YloC family endoribonuclease n=1 Tax=Tepidimonas sp. TaxID=2002775 RepID=UPI00298EF6DF|nr:YicC/YloC family endoribonuclease [Tepidimonas sp.]MDW8335580.1 YicC/YloC family endoribonuclease [Tepidimonas sp.]